MRITHGMLTIGEPLPFNIYKANGTVLIRQGVVLYSQSAIDELCARECYSEPPEPISSLLQHEDVQIERIESVASYLQELINRVEITYNNFATDGHNIVKEVTTIASQLVQQLEHYSDELIGIVHLRKDLRYSILRTLQNTIFAVITANRLHWEHKRVVRLACASLTANLALYPLQDELNAQESEIQPWQEKIIHKHPVQAVKMLITMGVRDKDWLEMVGFHHERMDGSGYPNHLIGDSISEGARLMAVVDQYGAAISSREKREAGTGQKVMRDLLSSEQNFFDSQIARVFVAELGVYPPGATVQLSNGETGIVVERKMNRATPIVAAIWSSTGELYGEPIFRQTAAGSIQGFAHHGDAQWLNPDALWGTAKEEAAMFNREKAIGLLATHSTEEDITLF